MRQLILLVTGLSLPFSPALVEGRVELPGVPNPITTTLTLSPSGNDALNLANNKRISWGNGNPYIAANDSTSGVGRVEISRYLSFTGTCLSGATGCIVGPSSCFTYGSEGLIAGCSSYRVDLNQQQAGQDIGIGTARTMSAGNTAVRVGTTVVDASVDSAAELLNVCTEMTVGTNASCPNKYFTVKKDGIYSEGLKVPVVHGAGTAEQAMESGSSAMTAGELAITFGTAFGAAPTCICTHVNTTNGNACNIKSGSAPTTTAVTFAVASGGTDVVHWFCTGNR